MENFHEKNVIERGKNIYFISDLHIGHDKLIKNLRGFSSTEEHDEFIINQWNSKIKKNDVVWILGDLTMEKNDYSFLNKLKGIKHVILGNHDLPQHTKELQRYVNKIGGMVKLKKYDILLSHCPVHESEIDRFKLNIHGHVHENSLDDKRYFNVSCEAINYTPISLSEIFKIVYKL